MQVLCKGVVPLEEAELPEAGDSICGKGEELEGNGVM